MLNISIMNSGAHKPIPIKFLHVGHHKCGSTFLQTEAFPKIKALTLPPGKRPDGTSNTEFRRAWIALATQGEGTFDFEAAAAEYRKLSFNCVSNEAFVGFGTQAASTGSMIRVIAERLKRLFGETNILIVIRNQKQIVPSMYADDIEYGFVPGFERWLRYKNHHYQLDWFRYAPIIEIYQKLFGRDRVRVILFEDLFHPETVTGILNGFGIPSEGIEDVDFGKRVNPGMSRLTVGVSRVAFRCIGTRVNMGNGIAYKYWLDYISPLLNGVSGALGLRSSGYSFDGSDEILRAVYHDDNCRVSELIGVDLHTRGYP